MVWKKEVIDILKREQKLAKEQKDEAVVKAFDKVIKEVSDLKDSSEQLCIVCGDVALEEVKGRVYCKDCVKDFR